MDQLNTDSPVAVTCPNLGLSADRAITGDADAHSIDGQLPGGFGDYLTMQEAAKIMKIGVRTLYRYLDSGRIPRSYRLPGRRLVAREDVRAFMEQCVVERAG